MIVGFCRQALAFGLALACTWWLLHRAPLPMLGAEAPAGPVSLQPVIETAVDVASFIEELPSAPESESEPEDDAIQPPPPEAGSRDGVESGKVAEAVKDPDPDSVVDEAARSETAEEVAPEPAATRADASDLSRDEALLTAAAAELAGEAALGFSTVFVSSPEDQLDIALAFREEVVLVPRAALDAEASGVVSYRLDLRGTPRVVEVAGRPELERFRQYRDLFAYDFARLPKPLRTLRASVVRRDEVFLFAALIPVEEWAVVVGRRREALEALGVDETDAERFVLRYVRRVGGRFDIVCDEVWHVDGRRLNPPPYSPQSSARSGRAQYR